MGEGGLFSNSVLPSTTWRNYPHCTDRIAMPPGDPMSQGTRFGESGSALNFVSPSAVHWSPGHSYTDLVVRVRARAAIGDTVMVDGRSWCTCCHGSAVGPARRGRPMTRPCRVCERRLQYDAQHRHWRCPDYRATYSPTALAAVCQEVERNARQLQRGIPGATALVPRAAEAGGALGRDVLPESVTGAERHTMRRALRDVGGGPLSPELCRQAAQVLLVVR